MFRRRYGPRLVSSRIVMSDSCFVVLTHKTRPDRQEDQTRQLFLSLWDYHLVLSSVFLFRMFLSYPCPVANFYVSIVSSGWEMGGRLCRPPRVWPRTGPVSSRLACPCLYSLPYCLSSPYFILDRKNGTEGNRMWLTFREGIISSPCCSVLWVSSPHILVMFCSFRGIISSHPFM